MPAFTFQLIGTPPADAIVNEQTQLNGNLNQLENRLNWLQDVVGATWADVDKPKGLEKILRISGNPFTAVWNGTTFRTPTASHGNWTAWTNIGLVAPYVASAAGYTPQYRNNTTLRRLQIRGRIANTAAGNPMNKTAWTNFSSGVSGIPLTFTPLNNIAYWTTSVSPIVAVASDIAAARLRATVDATSVRLDFNWMGQDSNPTGNYISLENMEWWY